MIRTLFLLGACALFLATGCGGRKPVITETVKLVILDGFMMEQIAEGEEVRTMSYWFGQHDRIETNNSGIIASEALQKEFAKVPNVELYPRSDLGLYLATKERRIRRAYPDLTNMDRLDLLMAQSPVDYGRSLNVDYVLLPTVESAATVRHALTDVWSSRARMVLKLYDVETGEVVWTYQTKDRDWFWSQTKVFEDLAKRARKRAVKQDAFGFYQRLAAAPAS